ncbi:hypothetical protein Tco_1093747 [Tanacetum coccineum]|uniref:Integrase, catalytic region, zinc finger, CCHC-type, peptidase aspartic, catalytic n=1 Tax=Tanacetum coccineum TaxID=301880 RepID=A0ABQ5IDL5_9ASTR
MLEKSMYDSWASRIRLFIKGKKNVRMMLDSIHNGLLDVQATNIILHGLPPDVLYNLFDKFASVQGETLYEYYWRFSQLINNMHTIGMTMQQVQVNTKFLNALPPEWSKFVTDVKLAKSLYTTNYDQLFPPSNNQLRMSSNPRNQATIQDGRVTVQQVKRRQTQSFAGTGNKEIATTSRRNYAASQPREKLMLVKAQEAGQILDEEQLAFIADPGIEETQVVHCDSKVLFEVPYSDSYPNDMINQDVQEMTYTEQIHIVDFQDNEINSDSNIIPYSQYMQESQDAGTQDTNSSAPNDLLVLSLVEQMTGHVANFDKENQTNKMVNESLSLRDTKNVSPFLNSDKM